MGLLDDLKNQADSKKAEQQAEAERQAKAEQFYREKILPRMVKAYQYINQFIDHLKVIEHETVVEYPILPQGKKQPFTQGGYMVVIDSSKNLKKIDFSMECTLETPVQFELFGKEVVLSHADRISQYSIKHERKDRKGPSMEIESAKFTVTGPLPLRVSLVADVDAGNIKLTIRNFIEPGFQHYTLKLEQFNDKFLDRLGHFVLRQDMNLFGKQEISEEQKKKIRDRMLVEQKLRQEELQQAEKRAREEAEAEAANTTKEQLKRAVNTTVSQGKENLKGMFKKIKQTASQLAESQGKATDKTQSKPAQSNPAQPVSPDATNPAEQKPKASAARQAPPAQAPGKPNLEAATKKAAAPVKKAASPENKTASRGNTQAPKVTPEQKAVLQAKLASQMKTDKQASNTASPKPAVKQPDNTPQTEAKKSAAPVKKSEPPRVYQAPSDNPFLTPDDMLTPEQIKEQAEKEKRLKEQTRAEMIAEKARANVEAEKKAEPEANTQLNTQQKKPKVQSPKIQSQGQKPAARPGQTPVNKKPEARQQSVTEPGSSLSLEPQDKTKQQAVSNKTPAATSNKVGSTVENKPAAKPAKQKKKQNGLSLSVQEHAKSDTSNVIKSEARETEPVETQSKSKTVDDILQKGTGLSLEGESGKDSEEVKSEQSQVVAEPVGLAPELDADGIPVTSPEDVMDFDLNDLSTLSDSDIEQVELEPVETDLETEKPEPEKSESDVDEKPKHSPETNSTGSLKEAWQQSRIESELNPQPESLGPEAKEQEPKEQQAVSLAPEMTSVETPLPVEESFSEPVRNKIDGSNQQQEGQGVPTPNPATDTDSESKIEPSVSDEPISTEPAEILEANSDTESATEDDIELEAPADIKQEASVKLEENQVESALETKTDPEPAPDVVTQSETPSDAEPEDSAKIVEQQSEPVVKAKADPEPSAQAPSVLSLEDELERDLANIIENEQLNKTAQKTDESDNLHENPKIDLSAPDELEIDFDNQDGATGSVTPPKSPDTKK